ncbi:MAG: hypothetical protein OEV49_15985 [candidate division Zixibacteria bacterium]|nr:hypothetical protein [candidate division Zixibacteria bacterium]MDH3936684.1 hypothetical protein [candidate division Zixibacteria bacterium]MDH4034625.1 hypothetical protein [candidate division Zixibacteria bacterium]
MRRIRSLTLGALLSLLNGLIGCGGNETEAPQLAEPVVTTQEASGSLVRIAEVPGATGELADDWTAIHAVVDEVITRLSYGDKSGLWENEFSYLHEQETFDDYLKRGEVQWANVDGLEYVEIKDILFFGKDSALVETAFYFNNIDDVAGQPMPLMTYYRHGRWIRPYVATIQHQLDYDALLRQADDDAGDDW